MASERHSYDLSKITEFNPALIYGFDPQLSQRNTPMNHFELLLLSAGQIEDMFNAYYYRPPLKKGAAAVFLRRGI